MKKIERTLLEESAFEGYIFPRVTVVIPCFHHAHLISLTLESVLEQGYPDLEVIVIDGGSTDRTLEVVKSYSDSRIRIVSVATNQRFEMLNKGISLAQGKYINFLLPGDDYIHQRVLKLAMKTALDHDEPHLVYSGCLIRDGQSEPKVYLNELSKELLIRGKQATSLQSCWFEMTTFRVIGKFRTPYYLRGGFEFLCRFIGDPFLRAVAAPYVLTDFTIDQLNPMMIANHFQGTFSAIRIHFGWFAAIRWLFIQKDLFRFIQFIRRRIRISFLGK